MDADLQLARFIYDFFDEDVAGDYVGDFGDGQVTLDGRFDLIALARRIREKLGTY